MTARRRPWAARAGAVLLGLALALGSLEVGLRTFGTVPLQRNPLSGFHRPHEVVGWLGARDYAARFRRPDFDVVIESDELGFRRSASDVAVAPGAPRVAFLGDSFTWGWGVGQGAVYTDRLQRRLGPGVHVRNFGVNAFGTGQQLLLLEELVFAERPRVVTVAFCFNDIVDNENRKGGRRPWYRLEGAELVLENCPVERAVVSPGRAWMRRSFALSALRYGANSLKQGVEAAFEDDAPEARAPGPPEEDTARRWELARALLARMRDRCREEGAELRVFYVTGGFDFLPDAFARTGLEPLGFAGPLSRLCAELGIPFLDPTDDFERTWLDSPERGPNGQPLYFHHDQHWTAAGHELAAEVLARDWDWPGGG